MPEILAACQLFVLSSRWEGMPNVLLEALASDLPCVATDVEGVRELLGPGDSGRIVTSGDVNALRIAVKSALCEASGDSLRKSQHIDINEHTWIRVTESYSRIWRAERQNAPPTESLHV